jgi:hypothetical protein
MILNEFGAPTAYLILSGFGATIVGIAMSAILWRGIRNAHIYCAICAGLYFAWYWVDRLWIQSEPNSNWPMMLIVSGVWLINALVIYYAARHQYLKEKE